MIPAGFHGQFCLFLQFSGFLAVKASDDSRSDKNPTKRLENPRVVMVLVSLHDQYCDQCSSVKMKKQSCAGQFSKIHQPTSSLGNISESS
jgi:hypothetical protein